MDETFEKISENQIRKTTEEIIDLAPLRAELADIETELIELEKEPDEILVSNDEKFHGIEIRISRKQAIEQLLNKMTNI